jgi:CRISPR system Cascade subunit CasB
VFNNDTAALQKITQEKAQQALYDWFTILSERHAKEGETKVNGRAWRAEIKRMQHPYDAMMSEGYSALRQRLIEHMALRPIDDMALALFVSVAVHIKKANPEKSEEEKEEGKEKKKNEVLSFAAQLGEEIKNNKPIFSRLRFQSLQKARDPETFCRLLIRAVKIRGDNGVNILSLADSIFLWMEEWQQREAHMPENPNPFARNRIRWANEYLSTAPTE